MAKVQGNKNLLTVKNIRVNNKTNLLKQLVNGQNLTRNDLARESHISLMTVKHIVDGLIEEGIVEEHAFSAAVGRRPKALNIAEKYGNIVCINLTSTESLRYLIYDLKRKLLAEGGCSFDREKQSYQKVLAQLVDEIRRKLQSFSTETVGVGVSVPSAYYEKEDLTNYDLIPAFKGFHIRQYFQEAFGLENVAVVHDVVSAAKSEYESKPVRNESIFYFYCGFGVGGCFMLRGEAVTGEDLLAGEVGKMQIDSPFGEGMLTLEEIVSVPGILRQVHKEIPQISFEEVTARYKEGAKPIAGILDKVLKTISRVLYNMVWLFNPAKFVVDSCNEEYAALITESVKAYMQRFRQDDIYVTTEVEQAVYREYDDLRGCFRTTVQQWIESLAEESPQEPMDHIQEK